MLHPSYTDLINVVNSDIEPGEQPVVQSRYSIVIAASKRARQLIAGDEPLVAGANGKYNVTAITSGGSQAVFFKVNTVGENAFLDTIIEAIDRL